MKSKESIAPDPKKKTDLKRYTDSQKSVEGSAKGSASSIPSPLKPLKGSNPERELAHQLTLAGIPFLQELCPIPGRKFRFDFACHNLLIEVQGGIWVRGGHSTGTGISRDCEKLNLAVLEGWRVFHVTPQHIKSGEALAWIQKALCHTNI